MAIKFAFVFLVAFILCQVISSTTSSRIPRDTASQTIDELFNSVKTSVEEMVKIVQNNEVAHDAAKAIEGLSESIKTQGSELIGKIN